MNWFLLSKLLLTLAAVIAIWSVALEYRQWKFEKRYPTSLRMSGSAALPGQYPYHVVIYGSDVEQGEIVKVVGRDRSGGYRIERGQS